MNPIRSRVSPIGSKADYGAAAAATRNMMGAMRSHMGKSGPPMIQLILTFLVVIGVFVALYFLSRRPQPARGRNRCSKGAPP